jgi:hypothetical protein
MKSIYLILLIIFLIVSSCSPKYTMPTLDQFSIYEKDRNARHISPDGIRLMVRTVPNNPKGDLPFWKEAIRKHLDDSGYLFQAQKTIDSKNNTTHAQGEALSFIVPYQGEDWGFAVVIFVNDEDLTLVEMTGPFQNFPKAWEQLSDRIHLLKIE